MNKKNRIIFRRKRGRLIPIRVSSATAEIRKETKQFISKKNRVSLAKIAGYAALGVVGSFGAGKLYSISKTLEKTGSAFSKTSAHGAKLLKYGSHIAPAGGLASEMTKIDRRSPNKSRKKLVWLKVLGGFAGGYGFYRFTKRMEVLGKTGKFVKHLKDI